MEQKGIFALAMQLSFRAVVLEETPMEGWTAEELPGSHWSRGVLFARLFQEADLVVQTCCLKPQIMLFGTDRVALDAVGVAILRMHGGNATISRGRIFDQDQIARAVQLGLGVKGPDGIELVTDDPESRKVAERIRAVLAKG